MHTQADGRLGIRALEAGARKLPRDRQQLKKINTKLTRNCQFANLDQVRGHFDKYEEKNEEWSVETASGLCRI